MGEFLQRVGFEIGATPASRRTEQGYEWYREGPFFRPADRDEYVELPIQGPKTMDWCRLEFGVTLTPPPKIETGWLNLATVKCTHAPNGIIFRLAYNHHKSELRIESTLRHRPGRRSGGGTDFRFDAPTRIEGVYDHGKRKLVYARAHDVSSGDLMAEIQVPLPHLRMAKCRFKEQWFQSGQHVKKYGPMPGWSVEDAYLSWVSA